MKTIISFTLRKIPRTTLQKISHFILPLIGLFFRGDKFECPISGRSYRKFLPYGRIHPRPNALCPDSLSLERHRLMWLYLQEKTNFFTDKLKILHIAPELCFIKKFEALHGNEYITADLESPLAKVRLDIHDIPFEKGMFDVAFCNHVMEHVDDDIHAMSEIYRVLKPGGWAIIQSPVYYDLEETFEDPNITSPAEREKAYGQNDHQRKYGRDYAERLRKAGFEVTEDDYVKTLPKEKVERFALPEEEIIYFCQKK